MGRTLGYNESPLTSNWINISSETRYPFSSIPSRPTRPGTWESQRRQMLTLDLAERAQTVWTESIMLDLKKERRLQFGAEYCKPNAVTIRNSYPIPSMDKCIHYLVDATNFSTLDASSGYWQVEFSELDCNKTAFASHHGESRFIRMSFGLKMPPRRPNTRWKSYFAWLSGSLYWSLDLIIIF